jgi:exosortase/archaeosortase family protein
VIFEYQFRHLEAVVVAHLYRVFTPVLAASSAPIIWFGLGRSGAYGLEITPDCSSALLIVPLCGLGMLLMIPRRLAVSRVTKALAVAATVLVGGNLLRIGVIALAIRVAGIGTGYQIGHLLLGSIVSIICIAISLALLTAIVVSRPGSAPVTDVLFRRHRRATS